MVVERNGQDLAIRSRQREAMPHICLCRLKVTTRLHDPTGQRRQTQRASSLQAMGAIEDNVMPIHRPHEQGRPGARIARQKALQIILDQPTTARL
jgi:hypothetical protein